MTPPHDQLELAARAIAAHGLDHNVPVPDTAVADADWRDFGLFLERHRLIGLAAAAVRDDALPFTEAQRADLAERDETWQTHALNAERVMQRVATTLAAADVRPLVIKGPALAYTVFADPAHRPFGDIDVLVPAAQLGHARAVLVDEVGVDDPVPELRPGFDAEFAKDVLLRLDRLEIDLHRTIAPGPFGLRLPVRDFYDNPRTFRVGSADLQTMSPLRTMMQVCCNAALGDVPPRLMSLRDVAQVATTTPLAVDDVADLAGRWRIDAVVAHAIREAWSTLALAPHPLSEWAAGHRARRLDEQLLRASISTERSYTRHVAALVAVPGNRARLRYARAILSPQDSYLEARGWERGDHVRRALTRLRRARST